MAMEDPLPLSTELQRAFPILRDLPERELANAPVVRVEKKADERFFDQGDPGDAVYGIVTGRVRIVKQAPGGRELALDVFGPGELISAVAVLRGIPMPASAIALEPTLCLRIDGPWFQRCMRANPGLAAILLDLMMNRLVDAGNARLGLATAPVEARLAAVILRMAEKFGVDRGGEIWVNRSFTRQNLADLAGTTVETTIRVMSRWTKEGWIDSHAARILIRAPHELQRLAEQE